MRCYRNCVLLIALAGILSANALAKSGSLVIENCGDHLKVRAPQMHFLEGEALEMLHNGATVTYILTLTVAAEQAAKPEFLLREQFLISFDLWEEKYSVVKTGPDGRSASRLTAVLAETWCLENMPIPLQAVPAGLPGPPASRHPIRDSPARPPGRVPAVIAFAAGGSGGGDQSGVMNGYTSMSTFSTPGIFSTDSRITSFSLALPPSRAR